MAYDDLHEYLDMLESMDELRRVTVEVDPVLEVAEITRRVCRSAEGRALLFERLRGGSLPVVINMFGSWLRMCRALGVAKPDDLTRLMEELLAVSPAGRFDSDLLAPFSPNRVPSAPCQHVVEPDAASVFNSALKNWPHDGRGGDKLDGGRFLTLPLVITAHAENGRPNCGMYRVELFDASTCGIHWYSGSGGASHCRSYAAGGKGMPVAVCLGGDPALMLAAAMPLPESVDEMAFAGFLRGRPLDLVQCRTSGLMVPAGCELVIEGVIEPDHTVSGGAFGNHTGFYAPGDQVPVMRMLSVTRRFDALLPATVVGPPPMEDCFMGKAMERLLLPLLRRSLPEVVEINLPMEGFFQGGGVVSIRKTRPGQGREVIERLWEGGWLAASRLLVVVDADVNPHDLSLTGWWTLNHADWRQDLVIAGEPPGRSAYGDFGGRLGIDATRKGEAERPDRAAEEVAPDRLVQELVTRRWREYGLEAAETKGRS